MIFNIKQTEGAVMFVACAATALWVSVTGWLATPLEILRVAVLFCLFLAIKLLFRKNLCLRVFEKG